MPSLALLVVAFYVAFARTTVDQSVLSYIVESLSFPRESVTVLEYNTQVEYVTLTKLHSTAPGQVVSDTTHNFVLNVGGRVVTVSASVDYDGSIGIVSYYWNGPTTAQKSIRILTVNLWNHNWWELRLSLIAAEIVRSQADVICIQEVRARRLSSFTSGRFQVQDLAQALGNHFQFVFQPGMNFSESQFGPEEWVSEGLAVFSRLPIVSKEVVELSRDPEDRADFHQRIALSVVVSSGLGYIAVVSTHMSLSHTARLRTLKELGDFAIRSEYPVIICGDFNSELDDVGPILQDYGFTDTWINFHDRRTNGNTFNSWDRWSRIDMIFWNQDHGISPIKTELFGSTPMELLEDLPPQGGVQDYGGVLYPSDHLFVMVEFS